MNQGRKRRLGSLASPFTLIFLGGSLFPLLLNDIVHLTISKALIVQASKEEPPRIAFDEILRTLSKNDEEKTVLEKEKNLQKTEEKNSININQKINLNSMENSKISVVNKIKYKQIHIQEMIIDREMAWIQASQSITNSSENNWIKELSPRLRARMELAQITNEELNFPAQEEELFQHQIASFQSSLERQTKEEKTFQKIDEKIKELKKQSEEKANNVLIAGQLYLKGEALGHGRRIEVFRSEEGIVKEQGFVDLKDEARFKIHSSEPQGTVVAHLIDDHNFIIARGEHRITELDKKRGLDNLQLTILPQQIAFQGHSFEKKSFVDLSSFGSSSSKGPKTQVYFASLNQKVDADESGNAEVKGVTSGSWSLVRTEMKDQYPGLYLIQSGVESSQAIYKKKMIEALISIYQDNKKYSLPNENNSVLIGQVLLDGKSIEGAEVDVEFSEDYKSIYFNSLLIPDPQLKATGPNGFFAFVHLPRGMHSLRATRSHQYIAHSNAEVDDGAVSSVAIKTSIKKEKVELKVYDAFNGQSESAQLEIQSLPEAILVQGLVTLSLPNVSRYSLLRATPMNSIYAPSLYTYSDKDEYIHLPLIREDWIQALKSQAKISEAPNTGFLVGFVSDDDYELYLPHLENFPSENIVFFDANGVSSQKSKAGGGFIVFNIPTGTQSVLVLNKKTELMSSQVIPVDENLASVLKFHF